MGFLWVHVGSFLYRLASPFHSFVTICNKYVGDPKQATVPHGATSLHATAALPTLYNRSSK